jgi:hypothetical protein
MTSSKSERIGENLLILLLLRNSFQVGDTLKKIIPVFNIKKKMKVAEDSIAIPSKCKYGAKKTLRV